MKNVLAFGSFDPLHEGHVHFLKQAKALGDSLTVVVATDSAIKTTKGYEPQNSQTTRVAAVAALPFVTTALLGEEHPHSYSLLRKLTFAVLALGYDQKPANEEAYEVLQNLGKKNVLVVRLDPFEPERFKGSLLRRSS